MSVETGEAEETPSRLLSPVIDESMVFILLDPSDAVVELMDKVDELSPFWEPVFPGSS